MSLRRGLAMALAAWLLGGCTLAANWMRPAPVWESDEFVVTFARRGDTPASLAARHLGGAAHAWMIEDYNRLRRLTPGQEVVIPKRPWNATGVEPSGYQLVPVLAYHDIGPQPRGRLVIGAAAFAEQMRYLKANGYRVVSLREFFEFLALGRQLPARAVVLTFDDGYRSFTEYAYPVLKELGFTATLFVYTDYVGAGRKALSWDELARLTAEGFQVEGHTKTHHDLRRRPGEPEVEYVRRLKAEMELPQRMFQQRFGRSADFLAYPYGGVDDEVIRHARENGFRGALTVFREGNSAFVPFYRIRRAQIYAEMSLDDFAKNLNVWATEAVK